MLVEQYGAMTKELADPRLENDILILKQCKD